MTIPSRVRVEELPEADRTALLARKNLGHMAFSFRDQVDVQPLMYVFQDGWIFARTSEGEKLRTLQHNRWVAFQVDDVRDFWNWESVVVKGAVHLLGGGGEEAERLRERAVAALREIVPETLGEADPAPARTIVLGIAVQELSGRKATLADPTGG